jgi:hypothetical protein
MRGGRDNKDDVTRDDLLRVAQSLLRGEGVFSRLFGERISEIGDI